MLGRCVNIGNPFQEDRVLAFVSRDPGSKNISDGDKIRAMMPELDGLPIDSTTKFYLKGMVDGPLDGTSIFDVVLINNKVLEWVGWPGGLAGSRWQTEKCCP